MQSSRQSSRGGDTKLWRVVAKDGVIAREGRSKDTKKVRTIEKGAVVEVGMIDGVRAQVKAPCRGWVSLRREGDGLPYLEPVHQEPLSSPITTTHHATRHDSDVASHGSGARARSAKTRLFHARQQQASMSRSPPRNNPIKSADPKTAESIFGTHFRKNQRVFTVQSILVNGIVAVHRGTKGLVVGPSTNPDKPDKVAVVFNSELYNVNPTSISDGTPMAVPVQDSQPVGGLPLPGVETARGDKTSKVIASLSSKYIAGVLDERTYEETLRSILGDRYESVVSHGAPASPAREYPPAAAPPSAAAVAPLVVSPPPPSSVQRYYPSEPYPSRIATVSPSRGHVGPASAAGITSDRVDELRRTDPTRYSMFCAISTAYLNKSMPSHEYHEALHLLLR